MMGMITAILALLAHAAGLMLCLSVAVAAAWLCWRAGQAQAAHLETGWVIPVGAFVLCMAAATGALLLLFQVGW